VPPARAARRRAVLAVLRVYGDEVMRALSSALGPIELMIPVGVELACSSPRVPAIGLVGGRSLEASRVAR